MKFYKISNTPIIVNSLIPFKGFIAINLFGVLFVRNEYKKRFESGGFTTTLNHESIHTEQLIECLFIFFYLIYVINYIINLIKYKDFKLAYRNLLFEIEAYNNQNNLEYLNNRNYYAWLWS